MKTIYRTTGLTLIELMISLAVAMLLSVAMIYLFSFQAGAVVHENRKEQAAQAGTVTYELLTRLLRHAQASSVAIAYQATAPASSPNAANTLEITNDSIAIDFIIPSGFSVWPNDVAPFTNNAIRVAWSNSGSNANRIELRTATSVAGLNAAVPMFIVGNNTGDEPRVLNLDLWPLQADGITLATTVTSSALGGYRFTLTLRTSMPDQDYTNPLDPTGPLRNFRTFTVSGTVVARN